MINIGAIKTQKISRSNNQVFFNKLFINNKIIIEMDGDCSRLDSRKSLTCAYFVKNGLKYRSGIKLLGRFSYYYYEDAYILKINMFKWIFDKFIKQ